MAWYNDKGADNDVVVSSRIRFARNLEDYPFASKLDPTSASEIIEKVESVFGDGWKTVDFAKLPAAEASSYAEKHFVSPEFVSGNLPRALVYDEAKGIYIMVCEEDHLRMQCILPGLSLGDAFDRLCEADDTVNASLKIAYDDTLGYLTHCPTNLGTGMRASVMLFLPALTMTKQLAGIAPQLSKLGLTLRGLYGEGSESEGCLYQISNQLTLGVTEKDAIKKLTEVVRQIIESERKSRASIRSDNADAVADMCRRAYGTLKYAELISSGEFMKLYSNVRLGIALGLVPELTFEALGGLMIDVLPATLTVRGGHELSEHERDRKRAELIRKALA